MVEKRTITFKREEIIEALETYYNETKDSDNPKIKFYRSASIFMDTKISSIELEIDQYESEQEKD